MMITLDISNEEFDAILGVDDDGPSTIFLNFPRDIRGVYEFGLLNSVVNIFQFKDQMVSQGIDIEDDSLYVFGIVNVRIEGVKGADFELTQGHFFTGQKTFHSWPYLLNKGDVICICGGKLSFLNDFYASIFIVAELSSKITLTFDYNETVPYDITNADSTSFAHSKKTRCNQTNSAGKLFDINFFREYIGSNREVIKDE